ncbi:putative amidophosphoribosyltransferase [Pelomonas saccharophila]|uniref:Amidophosphoribosyltransferase n=1 Tax=Roseateles saccharophilus TaxID=304 RepID=A0ABU1YWA6_ROSSA|nr:hypothetical protein [Roseateles saccharophilus]MDR7273132.1 putative amidophosphoribosyltransferase [Roseateles saccharophilus]
MTRTNLVGGDRPLPFTALGDYHKYWIDRDLQIRNEAFDQNHSGRILSVKNAGHPQHRRNVLHFADWIEDHISELDLDRPLELVVVPSCMANAVGAGLDAIATEVARRMKQVRYRKGSLRRTKSIPKLSAGGNRSLAVHRGSMEFRAAPTAPRVVVILDDVSTTGNSLIAAADKVRALGSDYYYATSVEAIALGKTVHD